MQDNDTNKKSRLIGEILLEQKIISRQQLEQALVIQGEKGGFVCSVIIKSGFAQPSTVFDALSKQIGVKYVDLRLQAIDPQAVLKVPAKLALHYKLMPYKLEDNRLFIALSDPLDMHKLDDLRLLLDMDIEAVLSYEDDILEGIQKHYGVGAQILEDIMARKDFGEKKEVTSRAIEDLEAAVEDASIIKFVNQIISQAVEERATDIHLEPYENELRVRFRVDGILYEAPIPDSIRLFHQAIVSRVKIMAHMDIAEHRLPQDGRIKIKIKEDELDLRVSVIPSSFGESVQIRILGTKFFMSLENIGLAGEDLEKMEYLINKSYGVVFTTGPTGSGKSTTLYSALSKKNLPNVKIITTEDPVEYQVRGITQIQIQPKIGLSFAEALRSILRHDPDIIMVGEVRDLEAAEIAIRSAMTGHLVFSTLHTNDACSAPVRLVDMGIEPFLVASSVEGVIAQRLVRKICPECVVKKNVPGELFRKEGLDIKGEQVEVSEGKGCKECRFTGFKGRTAIFEIMIMNDEIRDLIFKKATSQVIKEKAISFGMRTLRQDGFKKVLGGITTLSEVMRVA